LCEGKGRIANSPLYFLEGKKREGKLSNYLITDKGGGGGEEGEGEDMDTDLLPLGKKGDVASVSWLRPERDERGAGAAFSNLEKEKKKKRDLTKPVAGAE